MIIYILILHYLIYVQHRRQKRHEALTLAIIRASGLMEKSPPMTPTYPKDPMEPYN